jgi:threonine/homoserine/homoserine lactone efflux protein
MFDAFSLPVILLAALIASASPGPSTLAVAGTSMAAGRRYGLALASGITTGSIIWSIGAALGLGVSMLANAWVFEVIRYAGAGYLLFLACKSARSALSRREVNTSVVAAATLRQAYVKGLALHLTNPKAVLFFGSLYAVGIPAGSPPEALATVIAAIGVQSFVVFHGYALIFSSRVTTRAYTRLRRGFEAMFAVGFGAAGLKVLTTRIQ